MLTRPIPHTGETLPVLGLGTFRAFDQSLSALPVRDSLGQVLRLLLDAGGTLIDSSPSRLAILTRCHAGETKRAIGWRRTTQPRHRLGKTCKSLFRVGRRSA